jgi:competence protein ComEA
MGLVRTLWEILDHQRREPAILDSRDSGTTDPFAPPRALRWKLGVSAAIVLIAGVVVVVVGSSFVRSVAPAPEPLPALEMASAADSVAEEEVVVVHVVGAVARPGVVSLPASSRVYDALLLAGGALAEAELAGVNLARIVFDGEQIVVPRIGEPVVSASPGAPGLISLSRADQATLETLPRIGPATAERIIAWRTEHGSFESVEDLLAISGIGPATLEGLADRVVP